MKRHGTKAQDRELDLQQRSRSELIAEITRLRASLATRHDRRRLMGEVTAAHAALGDKNQQLLDTQRELEEIVELYFDLYDSAPIGYLMLDSAGVVQQLNVTACRLFRRDRSALVGFPLVGKVAAADRPKLLNYLLRCRQEDGTFETEIRILDKGQAEIPVQLSSRRAVSDVSVDIRTVVVDLRERLRLEHQRRQAEQDEQRQRASNEAKDRFLAVLSHELRTPLTPALFAAAHLLELRGLPADGQHLVDVIRRSIALEAELIDQLLDVTRIRTGKLTLDREPIDLDEIVREAVEICQPHAAARNQTVALHLRARNRELLGDAARMRQVFWNLLQNASKFSPIGAHIDVTSDDTIDERVRISVEDSGVGMSHDEVDRLFTPFETAERVKRGSGLGLGLSICRGIIEGHGGSIAGTSGGPGLGAVFAVELVAQPLSELPKNVPPAVTRTSDPRLSPGAMRILLVEDDQDSGDMLAALLTHLGNDVTVARSITEAAVFVDEPWDVVISDIGLPDGSGLEIGRRFRAAGNGQQLLIAMSGYGASSDIANSRQAGFDEHLVKPVDFNQLLMALRGPALN